MWRDIFHLFVEQNKKTVMEGNCWLNINIEGHTDNLYCLFWYFKITRLFSVTLLFYCIKIMFFLLVVWREKKLVFSWKRHWFFWWHSPSHLAKFLWHHYDLYFPAIVLWYSRSTIIPLKRKEGEISVIIIFEKYYLKSTCFYFASEA